MMRIDVGKSGRASTVLAMLGGGLLFVLACETPTPPDAGPAKGAPEAVTESVVAEGFQGKLRKIPSEGVTPQGEGTAVYRLRPTAEAGRVTRAPLVYIDGLRAPEGKRALEGLNPDDIDRVEVIKGPAAVEVFGEEASAGVVQIFLKK